MIDMTLEELIGAVRLENATVPLHSLPELPQPDITDGDAVKKDAGEREDPQADPPKSRA